MSRHGGPVARPSSGNALLELARPMASWAVAAAVSIPLASLMMEHPDAARSLLETA